MNHHCHARGCLRQVKPEMLMCFAHWKRVPRKLQRAVWAAYRPGQCDDKKPSAAWHQAADAAIGYVALLDRQRITPPEISALLAFGLHVARDNSGDLYVTDNPNLIIKF